MTFEKSHPHPDKDNRDEDATQSEQVKMGGIFP